MSATNLRDRMRSSSALCGFSALSVIKKGENRVKWKIWRKWQSWNMKAAWAALFSTQPALIYSFMSVIRFSCVHCSPRSTGNKALSLSRNNVPLSICAWNNRLQRSAGIAIIDHVCDVCSDIDSESLFNTDEWSSLWNQEFFADFCA